MGPGVQRRASDIAIENLQDDVTKLNTGFVELRVGHQHLQKGLDEVKDGLQKHAEVAREQATQIHERINSIGNEVSRQGQVDIQILDVMKEIKDAHVATNQQLSQLFADKQSIVNLPKMLGWIGALLAACVAIAGYLGYVRTPT